MGYRTAARVSPLLAGLFIVLGTGGGSARAQVLTEDQQRLEKEAADLAKAAASAEVTGNFAEARQARQKVLDLRKRLHGEQHWQVTDARLELADVDLFARLTPEQRQRHAEAARLSRESEELWQKSQFAPATKLARQALEIRLEVVGPKHIDTAAIRVLLGALLRAQGDYAAAREQYEKALEVFIEPSALGTEHPTTATTLNNLGVLSSVQGDYPTARRCYDQALAIRRKVLGPEHTRTAETLDNLGTWFWAVGDYVAAQDYHERALAIRRKTLPAGHEQIVNSMSRLALVFKARGDHSAAQEYYEQALALRRKLHPSGHVQIATLLGNFGVLLKARGDYPAARKCYEEALAINQKVYGPNSLPVARIRSLLGSLLGAQGDHAAARQEYEQALAARREKAPEQPDIASTLNGLGVVLRGEGKYAEARQRLEEALAVSEKALGLDHPNTATILGNLGALYAVQGDVTKARAYTARALAIATRNLELTSGSLAERQHSALLALLRHTLDAHFSWSGEGAESGEGDYQHLLNWKGAVFARQRRLRLLRGADPETAGGFAELEGVASRLATLALSAPDPRRREAWRQEVARLTKRKEELERALGARSEALRQEQARQGRSVADVRAALPAGVALLDFLEYSRSTVLPGGQGKLQPQRRLTAFVVRAGRDVARIDLGSAPLVAEAVERWRGQLGARSAEGAGPGDELRRLLWEPLRPYLDGAHAVLVSPDGALARFPFAALPGERPGTYLLEALPVAVVPVPRMLPDRSAEPGPRTAGADHPPASLLVGDVDFGATTGPAEAARNEPRPPGGLAGDQPLQFRPLPATAGEVERVGQLFRQAYAGGQVTRMQGAAATEAAFRAAAPRHRHLHLATHGFFAPPQVRSVLQQRVHANEEAGSLDPPEADTLAGWHPGLLSGLVLAGANRGPQTGADGVGEGDDGLLTAAEVAALDLSGAEVVVLSACETGLGAKAADGEAVLGLQRAFQVAGARTVVASLWQVDDEATQELMARFCANLWQHRLPPLEALRRAQLSILNGEIGPGGERRGFGEPEPAADVPGRGRVSPRYWAAWVLSGDAGDLSPAAFTPASPRPQEGTVTRPGPDWRWFAAAAALLALGLFAGWLAVRKGRRLSA